MYVTPKWTICLGLPLACLYNNSNLAGEIFLGDIGLAKCFINKTMSDASSSTLLGDEEAETFDDAGKYSVPFMDKFLVGLRK